MSFLVQVATVGRSQQPILNGYRAFGGDVMVLLPSAETETEAKQIAKKVDDMAGRAVCTIRVVGRFDLTSIVLAIERIHIEHPDAEILVNITGGTNVMASSALIACFIIGARAFYLREDKVPGHRPLRESVIELPVPRVGVRELREEPRRILRLIRKQDGKIRPANKEISEKLGMSFQGTSYHLKRLSKLGLISLRTEGRERVAELTAVGKLYAELVAK